MTRPGGERWEVYTVLADRDTFGTSPKTLTEAGRAPEGGVRCGTALAAERIADRRRHAHVANLAAPTAWSGQTRPPDTTFGLGTNTGGRSVTRTPGGIPETRSAPRGRASSATGLAWGGRAARPLSRWPRTRRPHRRGSWACASHVGSWSGRGHLSCCASASNQCSIWSGSRPRPACRRPVHCIVQRGTPPPTARPGSGARRSPRRAGQCATRRRTRRGERIVIGPHRPGTSVDDGDEVVTWPDTSAGYLGRPTLGAPLPQPATSAAGSRPSGGTSHNDGPAGPCQHWRLPATERSVTVLRRALDALLREAELSDDERYDLLLVTCEATSNAIEHARNPAEPYFEVLAEIAEPRVTITVCDYGQWRDAPAGPHRGRGLAMMWLLADTAVATGPGGTTVTIRSSPRHGWHPDGRRGAGDGIRTSSPR